MRRELLVGASIAAAALPLAGCGNSEVSRESALQHEMALTHLPAHLPKAVSRLEPDVVMIDQTLRSPVTVDGEKMGPGTSFEQVFGSGVRLGKDIYMTAGHILISGATDKPFYSSTSCSDQTINITTRRPTGFINAQATTAEADHHKQAPLFGTKIDFQRSFGTFSDTRPNVTDAAIIDAPSKNAPLEPYVPVKIADKVSMDEGVFFENFEPTLGKQEGNEFEISAIRDPDEAQIKEESTLR